MVRVCIMGSGYAIGVSGGVSSASALGSAVFRRTTSTTAQRLSRERGRVSAMRTTSPIWYWALSATSALNFSLERSYVRYFSCRRNRSTRTTTVRVILLDTIVPWSVLMGVFSYARPTLADDGFCARDVTAQLPQLLHVLLLLLADGKRELFALRRPFPEKSRKLRRRFFPKVNGFHSSWVAGPR